MTLYCYYNKVSLLVAGAWLEAADVAAKQPGFEPAREHQVLVLYYFKTIVGQALEIGNGRRREVSGCTIITRSILF